MKDKHYSPNTKVTFRQVEDKLIRKGYELTSYGDIHNGRMGTAYYEKGGSVIKVVYHWKKIEDDYCNRYVGGKMVSLEDVSWCYGQEGV